MKMLKKELIRMNRITQGTNIKYVGEDGEVLEISPQTLLFKPNKNVKTPTPVKDKARVNTWKDGCELLFRSQPTPQTQPFWAMLVKTASSSALLVSPRNTISQ